MQSLKHIRCLTFTVPQLPRSSSQAESHDPRCCCTVWWNRRSEGSILWRYGDWLWPAKSKQPHAGGCNTEFQRWISKLSIHQEHTEFQRWISKLSIHQETKLSHAFLQQFSALIIIIINVSWAAVQYIRMISEGSCDTWGLEYSWFFVLLLFNTESSELRMGFISHV